MADGSTPPPVVDSPPVPREIRSLRRGIIGWTVVCPVALAGSLIGTFLTALSGLVSTGGPSSSEFALGFWFSLTLVLVPTVGVTAVCISELRRRRLNRTVLVPCLVIAVFCAVLGSLATLPWLTDMTGRIIRVEILSAKTPTPEETSRTPAELRSEALRIIDETIATIPNAVEDDLYSYNGFPPEYCSLGNLDRGVKYPTYLRQYIFTTTADVDTAISAITDYWTEEGYSFETIPVEEGTPNIKAVRARGGIMASVEARYQSYPDMNRVILQFDTICVAE